MCVQWVHTYVCRIREGHWVSCPIILHLTLLRWGRGSPTKHGPRLVASNIPNNLPISLQPSTCSVPCGHNGLYVGAKMWTQVLMPTQQKHSYPLERLPHPHTFKEQSLNWQSQKTRTYSQGLRTVWNRITSIFPINYDLYNLALVFHLW